MRMKLQQIPLIPFFFFFFSLFFNLFMKFQQILLDVIYSTVLKLTIIKRVLPFQPEKAWGVRVSSSSLWGIASRYLRWRRRRNWECTTPWFSRRRSSSPLSMAKCPCTSAVSPLTTSVILATPAPPSALTSSTGLFYSSTI